MPMILAHTTWHIQNTLKINLINVKLINNLSEVKKFMQNDMKKKTTYNFLSQFLRIILGIRRRRCEMNASIRESRSRNNIFNQKYCYKILCSIK